MIGLGLAQVALGRRRQSRKGLYAFLEREATDVRGQHVLSVGAGGGVNERLLRAADRADFRVTQLDVDEERGPDVVADLCTWANPETYDLIIMSEVLEHLHSPKDALENVHESLKDRGKLVLTTPFVFPIHDEPYDYFRYTKHGLQMLLDEAGFERVCIEERNSRSEALCVLLSRTVRNPSKKLRVLSPLFVSVSLAIYPLAWALGKAVPAEFITTAYHAVAYRSAYEEGGADTGRETQAGEGRELSETTAKSRSATAQALAAVLRSGQLFLQGTDQPAGQVSDFGKVRRLYQKNDARVDDGTGRDEHPEQRVEPEHRSEPEPQGDDG